MSSLLERGLRGAVTALADALDSGPVRDMRPQQFDPSERTASGRRRTRQTEEQAEQGPFPEGERRPRPEIEVEPEALRPSRRAVELRGQLRNRASVQRAFLMMELLDKPRALRPYQNR